MDSRNSALSGVWGADYSESWASKFEAVFEAARNTPISVLIWGPSPSTHYYGKRTQLAESVADEVTSVATSEALFDADPRFGQLDDKYVAEEIQAEAADIVIGLAVADPAITGIHAELTKFGDHPSIGRKIHLLTPKNPSRKDGPLLLEAARLVPEPRRFEYTPEQYNDCQQMRAKVRQWVTETRRAKFLRERREKRP